MFQRAGDILGSGGGGQADGTARGFMHQPTARHMVGMGVGIDRGHQVDPQFVNQGQVAAVLLEHRVDQETLAAGDVSEQIREGAGGGIKQLPKQQIAATGSSHQRDGGGGGRGCGHGRTVTHWYDHTRITPSLQWLSGWARGLVASWVVWFAPQRLHHGALAVVVATFFDPAFALLQHQPIQSLQFLA